MITEDVRRLLQPKDLQQIGAAFAYPALRDLLGHMIAQANTEILQMDTSISAEAFKHQVMQRIERREMLIELMEFGLKCKEDLASGRLGQETV